MVVIDSTLKEIGSLLAEEKKPTFLPEEVFEEFLPDDHPFLLESRMRNEKIGRYSFISSEPFLVLKGKGRKLQVLERGKLKERKGNPLYLLKSLLKNYQLQGHSGLPFLGGAVGYFSYDLKSHLEKLPSIAQDDLDLPEIYLGFYDHGLIFDHFENSLYLVSLTREAMRRLKEKIKRVGNRKRKKRKKFYKKNFFQSNFTKKGYLEAVKRAIEYIFAGDIYQVNLSQRFHSLLSVDGFTLYQILQRINPSPFAAYLKFDQFEVVSSSPERFLRLKEGWVETRPIKGTRPRGGSPEEDEKLAQELSLSPKDRAENLMIVDLERNDLGKVCEYGSVKVTELFSLEKYATVFHLVSTVEGRLREGNDAVDLLMATFPGGSITGAPKIRAMEIIEELEPTKRGIYTGSIGYISFCGDMDLNIAIRTFLVKEGTAYFQVGGGIVADSDPEAEYQETLDKAKALIEAVNQSF